MLWTILSIIHLILFFFVGLFDINSSKEILHKVLWLLLIFLLPLIGLIIYYLIGRGK